MEHLSWWLTAASGTCVLLGSVFCIIGGIGILRLPDLYSRLHGAGITDTLGAGLVLVGLMLLGGWSLVTAKLLTVLVFLLITSPTVAHTLAKAAYTRDVPWNEATVDERKGRHGARDD